MNSERLRDLINLQVTRLSGFFIVHRYVKFLKANVFVCRIWKRCLRSYIYGYQSLRKMLHS